MHRLALELNENAGLSEIVLELSDRLANYEGKMGLLLDLNPIWRWSAQVEAAGLDPDRWWWGDPAFDRWGPVFAGELLGLGHGGDLNFESRFGIIDAMVHGPNRRKISEAYQPFLLRIVTHPGCTLEDREGLIAAAKETKILTVVNTHPVPQLIAGPGSELRSKATGRSGTLGGYLSDMQSGKHFAITCGHVATSGDIISSGALVGRVSAAKEPTPLPKGVQCHANCQSMTELDIALIEVDCPGTNTASRVADIVGNGDLVTMNGSSSGRQTYEVGALVVDHKIGGACWKKLIQLRPCLGGLFPPSLCVALTRMPQDGDSGSWVLRETEWAGMLVASDKDVFGYAMSSDSLVENAKKQFNMALKLS